MSEETAGGGASKLDTLSKEELVKLVKKYIVLHKQLKTKNEELTNKLNETSSVGSTSPPITSENNDSVVKELNEKIDSLRDENNRLNDKIKQLDAEIASLNLSRYEIEKSKEDMATMLETSRREIDLNKSMLDMLNNEINHLNGEKLQLEKKLINARRNTTPSVIVEEEEEDLEEEERESKKLDEEKERQQDGGDSGAGSGVGGLDVASRSHSNGGTPHGSLLFLNKDIEDMTFYVDELKSELEAERERNNEFSNEIRALKKELDELKQQPQNKDSNEINHIPKTTETESNNQIEENNQEVNGEHVSSVLGKLKELFENGWEKEESFNDQNGFGDSFREVSAVFRQKFSSYEKKLAEMKTKESYMEKQMEKIISDFKKEISDLESKLGEKETELNTLKTQNEAKLKALKSDLDSEREKSKTTQTKLEKFEKEAAKSKVLDLEIADYERSIKSLNVQIIAKEKDLTDARNEITQLSATVEKLRGDLERVETELSDEKEKSAKLKQLLVVAKKDLAEAKSHQAEQQSLDATSRHQIERLQIDLDAYKVQLVESGAERERLRDRVTALVEAAQRDEEETEKRIADKQEEIDELKKRLKDLEADYDAYKLKVQQAFKRQKEESNLASQNQASLKLAAESQAELERLQASVKLLTGQLDASNDRAVKLERANEALRDEYTMCLERNTKLLADLKHKESQWETRLNEVSRLASLKQDEHDVALRRLEELSEQKQGELRERIKNIQAQHCQAIDFLQKQLVEARNETERLGKQVEELNKSVNNSKSTPNDDVISNLSSRSRNENFYKANPLLIKVDDNLENQPLNNNNHSNGKSTPNSNSAQTPNGIISAKTIKSFEQLLNESSNNDENNDENEEASNSSKSPQSKMSSLMITQLKNDLSKTRVQIEHLNELLNESELNNARLSDQINLLKEEIRRLERNQEREKSISNMEYLKNVIMKFLTLSTVQERTQLIPVLSTMLRLSQEEQTAIINYSKAISSQQPTGSSGSSWGTYFPKWS